MNCFASPWGLNRSHRSNESVSDPKEGKDWLSFSSNLSCIAIGATAASCVRVLVTCKGTCPLEHDEGLVATWGVQVRSPSDLVQLKLNRRLKNSARCHVFIRLGTTGFSVDFQAPRYGAESERAQESKPSLVAFEGGRAATGAAAGRSGGGIAGTRRRHGSATGAAATAGQGRQTVYKLGYDMS
jgi:hypothetical protein